MIHRNCRGCKFSTDKNMEGWLLANGSLNNTSKECFNCYVWDLPERERTRWKSKNSKKIFSCQGCVHQTHDDMEGFLRTPNVTGLFQKKAECNHCYRWTHPEQERKSFRSYTKKQKG